MEAMHSKGAEGGRVGATNSSWMGEVEGMEENEGAGGLRCVDILHCAAKYTTTDDCTQKNHELSALHAKRRTWSKLQIGLRSGS